MKNKNKNKKKITLIIVLLVLVVILGSFMAVYRVYLNKLEPVSEDSIEIAFNVEENSTMDAIIEDLASQGLVSDKTIVKIYTKLNHVNNYYAGNFLLNKNMSVQEIFKVLTDKNNATKEQVKLTIAPGNWAKHVAKNIAEVTNLKEEDIMAKWNDIDYIYTLINKYPVLTEDIFESEHCYLEGYLFPETYYIYSVTTIEQVTEKILSQTEAIYEKYKDQIDASEFSIHEIFNLGSCILFEANTKSDMELVSSVFYNRMKKGMKLQSSSTVCYALYVYDTWVECEKNSNVVDSKYNTYMYAGLPIGPVCNATEMALEAALNPATSDYYYFIADVASGKCIFAKTYDEHVKNVNKYLR